MIPRHKQQLLTQRLDQFPAVALLGPRQAGKTTLAEQIAEGRPSLYLDLESPRDRDKLTDPELYLSAHEDKLVILDEVQRMPELFQALRGLIDRGRRRGLRSGRFLLLGSASMNLLRQSGESLAGRIAYVELEPLSLREVPAESVGKLWLRGGFPDSFLARDDDASAIWRENFIRTYLERDIPMLGPRIPAETLRRFWTMLAHGQGGLFNAAQLARGLGVDGKTAARYLDLLVDLLLVRRLQPMHANVSKRLIKSPKVYVRDSGLVHALLGLDSREAVLGHPVAGGSWEGFVLENLLTAAPERSEAYFYRTAAGAEIDLLLKLPGGHLWAVEIKRGLSPRPERGFHQARADLQPQRSFVAYSGEERYPLAPDVEAIGVRELAGLLAGLESHPQEI
ncbi:ATP-binding protein [Microbulbifer sp.]|uniref:ATP-binding protein n=1 Tax=Microbulbifer sp. TaxID=1908541 RepID=UPI003F34A61F